jgi:hypothetical protein
MVINDINNNQKESVERVKNKLYNINGEKFDPIIESNQ